MYCYFTFSHFFYFSKSVYAGNGFYPLGIGPRVTGRGGSDIAVADDTLSIHLNPAGMKNISDKRFDLAISPGVVLSHFKNKYNDSFVNLKLTH